MVAIGTTVGMADCTHSANVSRLRGAALMMGLYGQVETARGCAAKRRDG